MANRSFPTSRTAAARRFGYSLISLGAVCQVAPFFGLQLKALGDRGDLTRVAGVFLILFGGAFVVMSKSKQVVNFATLGTKSILWVVAVGMGLITVVSVGVLIAIGLGWFSFSDVGTTKTQIQIPPAPQVASTEREKVGSPAETQSPAFPRASSDVHRERISRSRRGSRMAASQPSTPAIPFSPTPVAATERRDATPGGASDAKADSSSQMDPRPQVPMSELRTWTDSTGSFKVEAQLCAYGGGKVMIKRADGQIRFVPFRLLSEADRDYVTANMPKDGPPSDSEILGGTGGGPFRSEGHASPLLGLRWSPGEWDNEKCIAQVDGLFDRQSGENVVVAREGYAVGAMNVDATRFVNAVQIVFMRIGNDGRLDPSDSYASDWLGFRTNKPPTTLGGTGAIVLGLCGRGTAVVDALGLIIRGR